MADFNMQGIDDLMSDLNTLNTDLIAPTMLEEAVPILEENVKRRTAAHKATGALAESMKASKAKQTKEGYSISVRPTGKTIKVSAIWKKHVIWNMEHQNKQQHL